MNLQVFLLIDFIVLYRGYLLIDQIRSKLDTEQYRSDLRFIEFIFK